MTSSAPTTLSFSGDNPAIREAVIAAGAGRDVSQRFLAGVKDANGSLDGASAGFNTSSPNVTGVGIGLDADPATVGRAVKQLDLPRKEGADLLATMAAVTPDEGKSRAYDGLERDCRTGRLGQQGHARGM